MKTTVTAARSKRILIVNPDLAVATVYQEKLESEQFEVEVAGNPKFALRIIELDPVDLAILDLSRSGTDAAQFLKAIRSQPGAESLPVVVLANPCLIAQAHDAAEVGVTRWVSKCDCTPSRMLAIVRETLASESEDARAAQVAAASANVSRTKSEEHAANIFFASAPYTIARLRTAHRAFVIVRQESLRGAELFDMHRQAGLLASAAGLAGFREIAQLACALETLLIELHGDREKITPSVIRTLLSAVDLAAYFVERAIESKPPAPVPLSPRPSHAGLDDLPLVSSG